VIDGDLNGGDCVLNQMMKAFAAALIDGWANCIN